MWNWNCFNRRFLSPRAVLSLSFSAEVGGCWIRPRSRAVLWFWIFLLYLKSCNLDFCVFLFKGKRCVFNLGFSFLSLMKEDSQLHRYPSPAGGLHRDGSPASCPSASPSQQPFSHSMKERQGFPPPQSNSGSASRIETSRLAKKGKFKTTVAGGGVGGAASLITEVHKIVKFLLEGVLQKVWRL